MIKTKLDSSELNDLIQRTLELWHVPGLVIGVLQDGQVTVCQGYGVRNIAQGLPVTSETLFSIASCTKAFTAMLMGMLVDEGRLDWNKPVKSYLAGFKMWDEFATERLTARDLLTHRCGLPGHDMLWYGTNFSRQEIFERLRFLEPTCDLRTAFQYQNLMYTVAGLLVEAITGASWEQNVQTRIFEPLGMTRSNCSTAITRHSSNFASPYLYRTGVWKELPFHDQDGATSATGPAGGIHSCVSDLLEWLRLHLNPGKVSGGTLISEANLGQMHSPQIFCDDPFARSHYGYEFSSYGLGWGMRSHKGQFLLEHDGMSDGFYSLVTMLPRHKIGIVALSNEDAYWDAPQANLAPNIISYTIYDRLLGLEPTDWNALMKSAYDEMAVAVGQVREQSARKPDENLPPTHPIPAYLGDFEHPGYGRISARRNSEGLEMVVNNKLCLPLRHSHSDTFEVYYEIADQWQGLNFLPDPEGNVSQVAWQMEPRVKEILFTRVLS